LIVELFLIGQLLAKRDSVDIPTVIGPVPDKPKDYSFDEEKFSPFFKVGETCPNPNKRLGPNQTCIHNRVQIRLK